MLETSEVAAASFSVQLRLFEDSGVAKPDRPRRCALPGPIQRMTVEILPGEEACSRCGGGLHILGEDGEWLSAIGIEDNGERGVGVRPQPVHREPHRAAAARLLSRWMLLNLKK